MAAIDPKKASQSLLKKGFSKKDNDHHYYEFWYENKMVAKTHISHGTSKPIHDGLISAMSKQCQLKTSEFKNLINCPLSKKAYIQKLKECGAIDEPTEPPKTGKKQS